VVLYIPVNRSDLTRWTLDFSLPCRTPPGPVSNDIRRDSAGYLAIACLCERAA